MTAARTITASTSPAELRAEYVDTCGYDLSADAALCRRFIRVTRILLQTTPQVSKKSAGGAATELEWSFESLQKQLAKAEQWLAANDATYGAAQGGGGGVSYGAASANFRS